MFGAHAARAVHQHDHRQPAGAAGSRSSPDDRGRLGLGVAGEELLVGQRSASGSRAARSARPCPGPVCSDARCGDSPARMQQRHAGSDHGVPPQRVFRHNRQPAHTSRPSDAAFDGDRECPVTRAYVPHGVIPAVILPFHDDLSIDEASFSKHLRDVAATDGLSASPSTRIRPRSPPAPSTSRSACSTSRRTRSARSCRSSTASGPTAARGRAHRQDGDRRRRLGAAGVPAGAVHDGPERRHGGRALQAHRRRKRPADHRIPVSARDRPGLSERNHPAR